MFVVIAVVLDSFVVVATSTRSSISPFPVAAVAFYGKEDAAVWGFSVWPQRIPFASVKSDPKQGNGIGQYFMSRDFLSTRKLPMLPRVRSSNRLLLDKGMGEG